MGCVYEQGVRAILGQLVSVAMAAKLASRVVALCGEPIRDAPGYLLPRRRRTGGNGSAGVESPGKPLKRAESLIHLAQSVMDGCFRFPRPRIQDGDEGVTAVPRMGRWTANYLALRGWQAKLMFSCRMITSIKQRFAGMTPAQIRRYAERWKPWRSYALLHLVYRRLVAVS